MAGKFKIYMVSVTTRFYHLYAISLQSNAIVSEAELLLSV